MKKLSVYHHDYMCYAHLASMIRVISLVSKGGRSSLGQTLIKK